jgi:chromosome segregation protein
LYEKERTESVFQKKKDDIAKNEAEQTMIDGRRRSVLSSLEKNRAVLNSLGRVTRHMAVAEKRLFMRTSSLENQSGGMTILLKDHERSMQDSGQRILQSIRDRETKQKQRKHLYKELLETNIRVRTLLQEKQSLDKREIKESEKGYSELEQEKDEISLEAERIANSIKEEESKLIQFLAETKEASSLLEKTRSELDMCKRELSILGVTSATDQIIVDARLLDDLETELKALQVLNMLSVDQYKQQAENYELVSVRINKLESERKKIIDFMDTIENQKRQEFLKSYHEVNKYFSEYFGKITGGRAWLALEDEANPFNGGIIIMVQFLDKSPRIASSLSGGEKSVSAICLIFALQKLKPSPFYVLDEVDAHLDVINVERYASILKDRSGESQVIVISLKDYVAGRADNVVGVYSKNGSSRILEMPRLRSESLNA